MCSSDLRYRELGLPAPYCCMSRNPGLGYDYYQEHKEQMYKDDGLYFNGKKTEMNGGKTHGSGAGRGR